MIFSYWLEITIFTSLLYSTFFYQFIHDLSKWLEITIFNILLY